MRCVFPSHSLEQEQELFAQKKTTAKEKKTAAVVAREAFAKLAPVAGETLHVSRILLLLCLLHCSIN